MAVGADFGVHVEIVQQDELAGELVQVGRDALGEEAQLRVAVALRQVAEDLVVGAVFLDDVDAVFDRARLGRAGWGSGSPARADLRWGGRRLGPGNTRRPPA